MNKKGTTGIIIEEARQDRTMANIAAGLFAALLVFFSLAVWFTEGFRTGETGIGYLPVLLPGAVAVMGYFAYMYLRTPEKRGKREPLILAVTAGFMVLALAVLFRSQLTEGAAIWADRFMDIRTELTGRIQSNYGSGESSESGAGAAGSLAVLFSVLMGTMAIFFARTKGARGIVLIMAAVLVSLVARISYPSWGIIAICAALILGSMIKAGMLSGSRRGTGGAVQGIGLISLMAVALALLVAVSGLGSVPYISAARSAAEELYHQTKYEKRGNPMPEGDLTALEAFEPSGRTSLVVTMTEPEGTYLRGYVGETFDGKSWGSLPGETVRLQSDVFYSLHSKGFYGQSQESMAYDSAYGLDAPDKGAMTVVNQSACGRYVYVPYGLSADASGVLDPGQIGDTDIFADSREPYGLTYTTAAVRNSYKLQQTLTRSDDSHEYESLEYAYRETVYDSYLDIPDALKETFRRELGEEETLSTTEAKIRILEYLDQAVTYDPETVINDTDDIITAFLTDEGEGQSEHYATCAAMMLRYFGVPARYAEGFIIPGDLADSVPAGEPIEIKEKYAHAWTEYYLDGVGWIPFETTPGYRNSSMYAGTDEMEALAENGGGRDGTAIKKDKKDDKNTNKEIDNPANRKRKVFVFRKIWIAFLAGAALLVFAVITGVRRLRLAAFKRSFNDPDPGKGLDNAFAYAIMLISRKIPGLNKSDLGAGTEDVENAFGMGREYSKTAGMAAKSLFSSLQVTEEERESTVKFSHDILDRYKASRSAFGRLYDRLIKCIY